MASLSQVTTQQPGSWASRPSRCLLQPGRFVVRPSRGPAARLQGAGRGLAGPPAQAQPSRTPPSNTRANRWHSLRPSSRFQGRPASDPGLGPTAAVIDVNHSAALEPAGRCCGRWTAGLDRCWWPAAMDGAKLSIHGATGIEAGVRLQSLANGDLVLCPSSLLPTTHHHHHRLRRRCRRRRLHLTARRFPPFSICFPFLPPRPFWKNTSAASLLNFLLFHCLPFRFAVVKQHFRLSSRGDSQTRHAYDFGCSAKAGNAASFCSARFPLLPWLSWIFLLVSGTCKRTKVLFLSPLSASRLLQTTCLAHSFVGSCSIPNGRQHLLREPPASTCIGIAASTSDAA